MADTITGNQEVSIRWRLKVSVRLVVLLWTLACAYLACWGPTKTTGVADVSKRVGEDCLGCEAKLPLVVEARVFEVLRFSDGTPVIGPEDGEIGSVRRCNYFWFFRYIAKLPYARPI